MMWYDIIQPDKQFLLVSYKNVTFKKPIFKLKFISSKSIISSLVLILFQLLSWISHSSTVLFVVGHIGKPKLPNKSTLFSVELWDSSTSDSHSTLPLKSQDNCVRAGSVKVFQRWQFKESPHTSTINHIP